MMQVPAILKPPFISLPPLHKWPRPVKRILLAAATIVCIGIYILLIAGIVSFAAIVFDLVSITL